MSQWYLDGYRVIANYFGEAVTGIVESSRVKYGGTVQHTVILDEEIQLPWRSEPTKRILVNESELIEVFK
jgi:hypothetical protein